MSSDFSESEPMDALAVEVKNNGASNVATSMLITNLPSTTNTRIVADYIPTSSTVMS